MKSTTLKYIATIIFFPILMNIASFSEVYFMQTAEYYPKLKYVFSAILILLLLLDLKKIKAIPIWIIIGIIIAIVFDYFKGNLFIILSLLWLELFRDNE